MTEPSRVALDESMKRLDLAIQAYALARVDLLHEMILYNEAVAKCAT